MALFRRSRDHRQQLDELERLIVNEFARQGVTGELVRDPDDPTNTHLMLGPDSGYGFGNLIIRCLDAPPKQWSRIIRDHVATMVAPDHAPPIDLEKAEVRDALRSRLFREQLTDMEGMDYARPFAPGLVEALCVDLPHTVETLRSDALAGVNLDDAFSLGRRNLARERPDEVGDAGDGLRFAGGSSLFIASRALDPRFVDEHIAPGAGGYVFGVPDRHLIFWHPVAGPSSVGAIESLVGLLRGMPAEERPGGLLSREVYYSNGREVQQITGPTEDGGVAVTVEGAFLDALNG